MTVNLLFVCIDFASLDFSISDLIMMMGMPDVYALKPENASANSSK